ncbi:ribbon-helix-helix domain-containing protein [Minwuia thermotolerans]|uniref:Aryl-sulfate sulfotransferase n=1 Tax=Minwuia thermotolerans TaxID=2056226 RepID=A0A2M9FWF5_9PROT|nr:ribbon-helix-helix domain-containing protein [Minwuia thermotolerans]PJK27769.1 aryl-sulfate sulfotransferase [Minwuia thermotolerans]
MKEHSQTPGGRRPRVPGTAVHKRSVRIAGHPTSISLEDAFWDALRELAEGREIKLSELVEEIDANRESQNLSSAIRVYLLETYRQALGAGGSAPRTEAGGGSTH